MKLNILKKLTALGLCVPMLITGCSNDKVETGNKEEIGDVIYRIGITEYMEHPSLDAAREGFVDEMEKLGVNREFDYVNAQGDTTNTQVIAEKFVKDKVDLIYSIATLSTQAAKKASEKTDIPVLFTAVTDPVYSQIVKATDEIEKNVTGVTDKVEAKEILKLAKDLKDGAKVVGIIYNTGESNSEIQIDEVKIAADDLDMTVETIGITTVNDIPQAMNTLSEKIDVLYMISDNMVASAIQLVANLAIEKNILTLSTIESQAADGVLISNGLSYYELGRQTAAMAKKILVDNMDIKDIHVESPTELKKIVNEKTMEALGLAKDNKAFEGAEFLE